MSPIARDIHGALQVLLLASWLVAVVCEVTRA